MGHSLGDSLTSGGCTCLNLADTEGDDEIGNDGILCLSGTMRDHDSPSIGLGELCTIGRFSTNPRNKGRGKEQESTTERRRKKENDVRLDTLANGADLVDLEEETVASLLLNGGRNADGVGDGKIITDDLNTERQLGMAGGHRGVRVTSRT